MRKILAFESSAKAASVAVGESGRLLGQAFQNCGLTHSRTLLPMAEGLLRNMDLALADMDAFAVAIGPGSFTGLRIGIAAVKGLAWSLERPCYGVSTLEAMARLIPEDGLICPVMDARRGQVYNALFQRTSDELTRLTPDRAVSLEDLAGALSDRQVLLVGDGAEMCYNWLKERGMRAKLPPEHLRHQSAWGVLLAAEGAEPVSVHDLTPNYIRLSQAERERIETARRERS